MIELGEAGQELVMAGAVPSIASLASVMERKGGGWAVMVELVTAATSGAASWLSLKCLIIYSVTSCSQFTLFQEFIGKEKNDRVPKF